MLIYKLNFAVVAQDLQKTVNHYMERPESPQIVTIDATNLNNLQWVSIVVESAR